MVTATGDLVATFDGQEVETKSDLIIPPSNTANQGQISVQFNVIAEGLTRDIPFEAVWTKNADSYDRIETDNSASSSVRLNSDLQLRFLLNSEAWNEPNVPPLKTGETYIYSIDVIADVGEGEETFDCVDRSTNDILIRRGLMPSTQRMQTETSTPSVVVCRCRTQEKSNLPSRHMALE